MRDFALADDRPDLFSGYRGCVVRSTPAVPRYIFNMVFGIADCQGVEPGSFSKAAAKVVGSNAMGRRVFTVVDR
jgi:hypothetical protein